MKIKTSAFLTALVLLALFFAVSIPGHAQEPQPDLKVTPAAVDCTQFLPGQSSLPLPGQVSSAGETPHLMPPHPQLLECVRQGVLSLPDVVTNSELKAQAGIDQPQSTDAAGVFRTLAILVNFTDKPSQVGAASFDTLLFGVGTSTLPDYYDKASYGILDIVTVNLPSSLGWRTMPQTYAYYTNNNYGIGSFPQNAQKMAADAARLADALVNYANYDNNNDGRVDTVFIVHAGRGAEYTNQTSDIWSHSWTTNASDRPTLDGKQIYSYTTEPEYWVLPGDMTVGVFAHELGHVLGLPDLYDTDDSSNGIGRWSLMAAGSWNGPYPGGGSPAFPDAWSRIKLGWVTPTLITSHSLGVSLPNVESNPIIFKVRPQSGGASEFFLVENRQKTLYDSYLPAAGLLIWHVDEAKTSNDQECLQVNNNLCGSAHYQVALEQADSLLELEKNIDSGDTGDPYPGSANRRIFNFTTSPNSSSYYTSSNTNLEISNISNSGATMSADFFIGIIDHNFSKISPPNLDANQPANPVLTWGNSLGATSYEYCLDTSPGSTCTTSWVNTGASTSAALNNLSNGLTYYWQVRSNHTHGTTDANTGTWWSFTIKLLPPGIFSKLIPLDGAAGYSTSPTLTWSSSSSAASYDYCIDTIKDNTCNTSWISAGASTSVNLSSLAYNTLYYWQVRAVNSGLYTYADGGAWESFATQAQPGFPEVFAKLAPDTGLINLPTNPSLMWEASSGASSYEYCLDQTDDNTCSNWTNVGSNTTITLNNLSYDSWYYWQVRAVNATGATAGNYNIFWSFRVRSLLFTYYLPLLYKSN